MLVVQSIPFIGVGAPQGLPSGSLVTTGFETPISEPEPVTFNLVRKWSGKTCLKPRPQLDSKPEFSPKIAESHAMTGFSGCFVRLGLEVGRPLRKREIW